MIITLCGSARFEKHFKIWNEVLSLAGHEVFGLAAYPSDYNGVKSWYSEKQKATLDQVHKRKIAASDAIVVLNVYAYIGDSTMSEIDHALLKRKRIYPLESWGKGNGINDTHKDAVQLDRKNYGIPENYVSPISTCETPFDQIVSWSSLLGGAGTDRSALIKRLEVLNP